MKRSNPARHARARFPGQARGTIGNRQAGADLRRERLRLVGLIAQKGGTPAAQMRIFTRRLMQGKRV